MNKVILIGRLVKDPELRQTPNGVSVCKFNLAVNRQTEDKKADFISCAAWGKTAENLVKYMRKGNQIAVEGEIQTNNYKNKDGKQIYVTEVLVRVIEFLSNPKHKDSVDDAPSALADANDYYNNGNEILKSDFENEQKNMAVNDDDLPF